MICCRPIFYFIASGFLFLTTYSQAPAQEHNQQAIKATWDDFIDHWHKQDATGCASFFAEDGVNIPPSFAISIGRKEIAQFYDFLFDQNQSSQYHHQIETIEDSGDHLVERGTFTVDWVRKDGAKWKFEARSLTHWVQTDDRKWQIKAFIFNESPKD